MRARPQQHDLFGRRAAAPAVRTAMLPLAPSQRCGRALRRRGWALALAMGAAAGGGLAASAWMQPVYEASGSVEAQPPQPAVRFPGAAPAAAVDPVEVQTLAEELGSRALAAEVVQQMGTAHAAELINGFWKRPPEIARRLPAWLRGAAPDTETLTTDLLQQLQIAALPQSRMIAITFRAPLPDLAAGFIQRLIAAELQRTEARERAQGMQRVTALSAQAEAARGRVNAAQTAVLRLAARHGLADPSVQLALATQRWQQLAQAETAAEVAGLQAADVLAAGAIGLPSNENTPAGAEPGLTAPIDLEARRAEAAAEVNRLAAIYRPQAAPMVQARQQLAALDRSLEDLREQSREARQRWLGAAQKQAQDLSRKLADQARTQVELQTALGEFDLAQRSLEANQKVYSDLLDQLQQAVAEAEEGALPLRVADPATPPQLPVRPRRAAALVYALVLGSLFGLAVVAALEAGDDGLRLPEAAEMGVPLLALLPSPTRRPRMLVEARAYAFAQALESCVASLLLAQGESGARVVLITSAEAGARKTAVAEELARLLAQVAPSVLWLDGGRPRAGDDAAPGLAELLAGRATVEQALRRSEPGTAPWFIPAGVGEATGPSLAVSLASGAGAELLAAARARFDWVVVDAGPIFDGPEAGIWSGLCDCCLVVAAYGRTPRRALRRGLDLLESSGSAQLGLIVNQVPEAHRYPLPAVWLSRPEQAEPSVVAMRQRA
ncbi:MAG: GumC family protein [Terriglobales bacterium]